LQTATAKAVARLMSFAQITCNINININVMVILTVVSNKYLCLYYIINIDFVYNINVISRRNKVINRLLKAMISLGRK